MDVGSSVSSLFSLMVRSIYRRHESMESSLQEEEEGVRRDEFMESSSREEEEAEEKEETEYELQQQLKHLEKEWDSSNQSNPGRVQVQQCWLTPMPTPMSSGGVWKVRNNDLAVEEILRERRAAIESGKLKGRRLFDFEFDLDDVLDSSSVDFDINIGWGEDSSDRSSVLIQGSEVRSTFSSSPSPYDGDHEDDGDHGFCHDTSSLGGFFHLSSSSSLKVESDEMVTTSVTEDKRHFWRGGGGERGMVVMMMGYFAIVVILFVLGIISLKSFGGFGGQQSFDSLIPT